MVICFCYWWGKLPPSPVLLVAVLFYSTNFHFQNYLELSNTPVYSWYLSIFMQVSILDSFIWYWNVVKNDRIIGEICCSGEIMLTVGSFFTMAFRLAIRITPSASVTVTTIGSPSGIAATANDTPILNIDTKGLPCSHPTSIMTPTYHKQHSVYIYIYIAY